MVPANATLVPIYIENTENLVNIWDHVNKIWIQRECQKPNLPPIQEELPDALTQLRLLRDQRLRDVDWIAIKYFTQGLLYPIEWSVYVQALRDLPITYSELAINEQGRLLEDSVHWPIKPIL